MLFLEGKMYQRTVEYIKEVDPLRLVLPGIRSRDSARRKHNIELVCQRANELARDRKSEILKSHLPVILQLATVCPFEDVRKEFTRLLEELKVWRM